MKARASRGAFAASLFSALSIVIACSGSSSTVGGGMPPEGATSQTCTAIDECPSIACRCGTSTVHARRCIDGYCLDDDHTCSSACSDDTTGSDGGSHTDAHASTDAAKDATISPAGKGDPCVPVSVSSVVPRVGEIAALIAEHQSVPPTPASGTVDVTRNTAGNVTYISYNATGTVDDYTDSLSYNTAGLVTYFDHNADGTVNDYTDSFSYNTAGLVTYFDHNADGTLNDFTESFSYNTAGLLTYFDHNADGTVNDITESFSYNTGGLVTYWSFNADGTINDATISVSYGTTQSITSNGTRAAGATVKSCK